MWHPRGVRGSIALVLVLASSAFAPAARAQLTEGTPAPQPGPYDWTFRARPAEITSFVRLDVSMSTSRVADDGPHAYAMTQLATVGVAVNEWLAPYVRGGWAFQHDVNDSEGSIFGNLELGASAIARVGSELRVGGHLALFLPTGSGQGMAPGHELLAQQEAVRTRMGTDSALFLTNHMGASLTGTVAYVHGGLVAQLELGLEGVWRVTGTEEGALAPAGAIHVGYFVIPELSLALELTHHQWAAGRAYLGSPRSITSVVLGARGHVVVGDVSLHPGASYSHALGGAVEAADYHVLQLDLVIDL